MGVFLLHGETMTYPTVVLYHDSCDDGFGAAWVAWKVFGDNATYLPVRYGEPFPEIAWNCSLYILDFSYPRGVLEARALDESYQNEKTSFVVLDHHKTAQEALKGLPFCMFDMEKSGARLAWELWNCYQKSPDLINYIEDRDLWRFSLKNSCEVTAWLRSYPRNFEVWDRLHNHLKGNKWEVFSEGEAILRASEQMVKRTCDQAWLGKLGVFSNIPIVNTATLISEVGNELCKRFPDSVFSATYYDREQTRHWSLRSIVKTQNSRIQFDVSTVARKHGGGGHLGAAGFVQPLPSLTPWAP